MENYKMEVTKETFKQSRQKLGMSLRAVARKTGLNFRTICNIENGVNDSAYSKVQKLANFYQVELAKLIKEDDIDGKI